MTAAGADAELRERLAQSEAEVAALREQQTATADVLRIIAGSPSDVQLVLAAVAATAARLCDAADALIYRREGDRLVLAVQHGTLWAGHPFIATIPVARDRVAGRAVLERRTIHVPDWTDPALADEYPVLYEMARQALARGEHRILTALMAPLLRAGEAIGVIYIRRTEVRPFTDKQIALLESFADQAVIAIENARLFDELEQRNREQAEALEREQATAEVLRVISQSPESLDASLQAVADTATRLCRADASRVYLRDGDDLVVGPGMTQRDRGVDILRPGDRLGPLSTMVGSGIAEVVTTRQTIHFTDPVRFAQERGATTERVERMAAIQRAGARVGLGVPLVRGETVVGVLALGRLGEPRPFSDREIGLAESFADQAAIAIENARLFGEIQAKSRELEELNQQLEAANQHKSAFVASMSHELRTPLNAIIGYSEMLQEEAVDLGQEGMTADLGKVNAAGKHLLSLINNILDLSKIEAGRMDLYLEDFTVTDLIRDVTAVVQPLVAKNGNALVVDLGADLELMHADLTKVRQALFNLLSNAAKFTEGGTITLTVSGPHPPAPSPNAGRGGARGNRPGLGSPLPALGEGPGVRAYTFTVADTGIGMTEDQQARLFQAFSQAEVDTSRRFGGTGLGLALSREFCRMMGGDIVVESRPGAGSSFTIRLPRQVSDPVTAATPDAIAPTAGMQADIPTRE